MLHPQWQNTFEAFNAAITRRQFFRRSATGLGVAALTDLLGGSALAGAPSVGASIAGREPWRIAPKAKRAIYISLIGAPSQLDLFDYKPGLRDRFGEDLKMWLAEQ